MMVWNNRRRIALVVVVCLGAALSLFSTVNLSDLATQDAVFARAAWASVPPSLLLLASCVALFRKLGYGFLLATIGSTLGLASILYGSTFLTQMETGYAAYGVILVAGLAGSRMSRRTPYGSD